MQIQIIVYEREVQTAKELNYECWFRLMDLRKAQIGKQSTVRWRSKD